MLNNRMLFTCMIVINILDMTRTWLVLSNFLLDVSLKQRCWRRPGGGWHLPALQQPDVVSRARWTDQWLWSAESFWLCHGAFELWQLLLWVHTRTLQPWDAVALGAHVQVPLKNRSRWKNCAGDKGAIKKFQDLMILIDWCLLGNRNSVPLFVWWISTPITGKVTRNIVGSPAVTEIDSTWKLMLQFECPYKNAIWLVVWNMAFIFPIILGSSSQLTFTPSFFRGVGWNHQPVNVFLVLCFLIGSMIMSHWIWGLPDFQALPSHQVTFLAAKWCPKMLCCCAICRAKHVDVSITNPVVKPSCKLTLIVLLITTFQIWQFTTKVLWIMNQPFQVSVTLISPIFFCQKSWRRPGRKALGPRYIEFHPTLPIAYVAWEPGVKQKSVRLWLGQTRCYIIHIYIYLFIYLYICKYM